MKKQKYLIIAFFVLAITGISSVIVGTSFAFFQADIKGETINEVSSSNMKISYTESKTPTSLGVMEDEFGMNSEDYFEFSLEAVTDKNSSFEYYVYITEEENNTINSDNIKLFLTDENDIPVNDEYTTNNLENGIYCYDYLNKKLYQKKDEEYKNCQNISLEKDFYIMDKIYYGQVEDETKKICRKYQKQDNGIENEIVDSENCRYGDVYKGNPIEYKNLLVNEELNLNNVIYKGIYKNINGTSYYDNIIGKNKKNFKLRVWANNLNNEEVEVITNDDKKEINQTKETFKYKVNVFAKQIELGY